jgi:hypothetical protein
MRLKLVDLEHKRRNLANLALLNQFQTKQKHFRAGSLQKLYRLP